MEAYTEKGMDIIRKHGRTHKTGNSGFLWGDEVGLREWKHFALYLMHLYICGQRGGFLPHSRFIWKWKYYFLRFHSKDIRKGEFSPGPSMRQSCSKVFWRM